MNQARMRSVGGQQLEFLQCFDTVDSMIDSNGMWPIKTCETHAHDSSSRITAGRKARELANQGSPEKQPLKWRSDVLLLLLLLHPFNGLFSRTTWVCQHQKGKPFWILLEQEMMGWQWHQLDHAQSFAPGSREITTSVPHQSVFTGQMPFLPPNQQCKSTEGTYYVLI